MPALTLHTATLDSISIKVIAMIDSISITIEVNSKEEKYNHLFKFFVKVILVDLAKTFKNRKTRFL